MTFLSKKGWGEKKSFVSFARLTPCPCPLYFALAHSFSSFAFFFCKHLLCRQRSWTITEEVGKGFSSFWLASMWPDSRGNEDMEWFFIRIPICLFQKLSSLLDFDSSECVIAGKRISSRQKHWKTMKPKLSEIALLMSNTTKPPQQQKRYNETFMKSSLFKTLP